MGCMDVLYTITIIVKMVNTQILTSLPPTKVIIVAPFPEQLTTEEYVAVTVAS